MSSDSSIQFQGDLELIGFSDVLQFLAGGRKSGALIVERSDGLSRNIYFDKGEIVAASSSRPEDYLGQILLRRGALHEGELERTLKEKPSGTRLGDALVARGLVSATDVEHYLAEQFRRIVFDTFHWSRGSFRFVSGAKPEAGRVAHSMSADNFVLEGLRRLDEGRLIERRLPADDAVLVATGEAPTRGDLSTLDRKVLEGLRDGGTRADLLRLLRADEFELKKCVFKLMEGGLLEAARERPPSSPESEARLAGELSDMIAAYNGIFTLIHQSVRLESGSDVEPPVVTYLRGEGARGNQLLQGIKVMRDGSLEPSALLANLASVDPERRMRSLADALGAMLTYQLGVVRERVGSEVATGILEMCSTLLR